MLKAKNDKAILLGLSDENLKRLANNEPIVFNLKELGLQDLQVIIFNGKDEQEMYKTITGKDITT